MTEQQYVDAVKRRSDEYGRNIQAVVCLRSALCWDDAGRCYSEGSFFACGRRMSPQAGPNLTPDFVVQFSPALGRVGELKRTASSDDDFRNAEDQLRRYDRPLSGWWTDVATVDQHQLACVVPHAHVGAAERWYDAADPFERDLLLISACLTRNGEEFFMFELRRGRFRHELLRDKFDPNTLVPMERVWVPDEKKFSDDPPPCPEYTMFVLWAYYFPLLRESEKRVVIRGGSEVRETRVDLAETRSYLRSAYSVCGGPDTGPRQPEVPRMQWLREAMQHFVAVGRAMDDPEHSDIYWVAYNPAARATNLDDFARQVYRECPPDWAEVEDEPNVPSQGSLDLNAH
ncbi:MAG: hypothetical protein ACOCX2_10130 [Armatimonadota bacterium]